MKKIKLELCERTNGSQHEHKTDRLPVSPNTVFRKSYKRRMENNGIEITPHLRDSTSKHPHTIIFIIEVSYGLVTLLIFSPLAEEINLFLDQIAPFQIFALSIKILT